MRRLRSLYLCYLSLDDPLAHTQVVAYLKGLAADGHCVHLLTFEGRRLTRAERRTRRDCLAAQGIGWHALRYHKRPSLPATIFDTVAGSLYATALSIRHRLDTLHARQPVPAAMALIAQRFLWLRDPALIFDIRGLMAEEYVDAGRWRRGSVPFRLAGAVQRAGVRRADGIVVLTERTRQLLFGSQTIPGVYVIPCCSDAVALASASAERDRRRAELGLTDATVMIYVGKFGGWYMTREMAEFFMLARRSIPGLHFLILTQGDRAEISRQLDRLGVGSEYTITSASPEQLGGYLAAADFGISFIRPAPSKASSSPTKIGEYLAAGLPIVSTSGIGDLDGLITPEIGTLVREHTEAAYQAAARAVVELLGRPGTGRRCRELARRELSLQVVAIPRYRQLYDDVAERAADRARRRGRRLRRLRPEASEGAV